MNVRMQAKILGINLLREDRFQFYGVGLEGPFLDRGWNHPWVKKGRQREVAPERFRDARRVVDKTIHYPAEPDTILATTKRKSIVDPGTDSLRGKAAGEEMWEESQAKRRSQSLGKRLLASICLAVLMTSIMNYLIII